MKKHKVSKVKARDDWGDKGKWVIIADFTKIKKGGVPISAVIKELRKIK